MIICLSGKSGSGKSFVASILSNHSGSIFHIDIDKISHTIINYEEVAKKLVDTFGLKIQKDGSIDRKELGKIVFNNKECMKQLEDITWPVMESEIDAIIKKQSDKIILLDWQLLPKTKYFKSCDIRILVTAQYSVRMKRAISRDNITEEKFLERENASIFLKEEDFDYVIINEDIEKTKKEVLKIYEESIVHR